MQTRPLGRQGLQVSALGLGCMGMSDFYGGRDEAEAVATINRALDLGVTFVDTADMYGVGANEELVGRVVRERREWVVVATKFGKAGDKVGVVGLGGLGHMAVKLAKALGAEVTVFTTDKDKIEAAKALGATQVVVEGDKQAYKDLELSFDFILSTVPEKHEVDPFITLLKRNATFCAVGALNEQPKYNNQELIMHRRTLAGSLIGSIKETQEVLDFCAEHGIAPDVQVIDIQDVNDAYKKVKNEDVRFRYVIDMASLKREMDEAA